MSDCDSFVYTTPTTSPFRIEAHTSDYHSTALRNSRKKKRLTFDNKLETVHYFTDAQPVMSPEELDADLADNDKAGSMPSSPETCDSPVLHSTTSWREISNEDDEADDEADSDEADSDEDDSDEPSAKRNKYRLVTCRSCNRTYDGFAQCCVADFDSVGMDHVWADEA
jgi:hypothetical protein